MLKASIISIKITRERKVLLPVGMGIALMTLSSLGMEIHLTGERMVAAPSRPRPGATHLSLSWCVSGTS